MKLSIDQISIDQIQAVQSSAKCLVSPAEIETVLDQLALKISHELSEQAPILLSVLTGAIYVTGHLMSRLPFPLELDYIHASRYLGQTSGGEMQWKALPSIDLANRTILIVDDILDVGATLIALKKYCEEQGAKKVYTAVLVEKIHNRKAKGASADFIGLSVEDKYLFGCGMDYKNYLRNIPGLYAVDDRFL